MAIEVESKKRTVASVVVACVAVLIAHMTWRQRVRRAMRHVGGAAEPPDRPSYLLVFGLTATAVYFALLLFCPVRVARSTASPVSTTVSTQRQRGGSGAALSRADVYIEDLLGSIDTGEPDF